jgi:hypothetical protein
MIQPGLKAVRDIWSSKKRKIKKGARVGKEEREARRKLGGREGKCDRYFFTTTVLRHLHGQELEMATFDCSFWRAAIRVCCSKSE